MLAHRIGYILRFFIVPVLVLAACGNPEIRPSLPEQHSQPRATDEIPEKRQAMGWNAVLSEIPKQSRQAVIVLADGDEGNIWLVSLEHGMWRTDAGPYYCRVDAAAGKGMMGELLCKEPPNENVKIPSYVIREGDVIVLEQESESYNKRANIEDEGRDWEGALRLDEARLDYAFQAGDNGLMLYSMEPPQPLYNGIAISNKDMKRLLDWIKPDSAAALVIGVGGDYGWSIEPPIPENFVFLTEAVPGAFEDARYATERNFTGRPMPGYMGKRVIVSVNLAAGLNRAMEILAPRGLSILVFDGYRPQRAVDSIFEWIKNPSDNHMKKSYYPNYSKSKILQTGMLSNPSPHTRAIAVDLTLINPQTQEILDMGGAFDLFDDSSAFAYTKITAEQSANRALLREVMTQAGFEPFSLEWWHFNIKGDAGSISYNFVIPN